MRILLLTDNLAEGGLPAVQLTLAEAFVRRGHRVGLFALESIVARRPVPDVWFRESGLRRRPGTANGLGNILFRWQAFSRAAEAIERFEQDSGGRADLILASGETMLRGARRLRHPALVFSSHSSQLLARKHPGVRGVLRYEIKRLRRGRRLRRLLDGRHVHLVSEGLRTELTEQLGVRPDRVDVIYNPFDLDCMRRLAREETPESRSVPSPYIVGVGAFTRRKRFDLLIDAFAASRFDGSLVLVGQGEEESRLREQARMRGVLHRVRIFPFHDNHYALLSRARALVSTSASEGFGNVLVEALAIEVPVVTVDCPHGPREIVEPFCPWAVLPETSLALLPALIERVVESPYRIDGGLLDRFALEAIVSAYEALAKPEA